MFYMKRTKLIRTIFLSILAVAAGFSALRLSDERQTGAAASYTEISASSSFLSIPDSYEQYLDLRNPTSVAHSEGRFAISDANVVYLYDEEKGSYAAYEHTYNTDFRMNEITQIGFASDGNLYFTDSSSYLFRLDCSSFVSTRTAVSCNVFTIDGDTLYYSTIARGKTYISSVPISSPDPEQAKNCASYPGSTLPALSVDGGTLLYVNMFYLTNVLLDETVALDVEETVVSATSDDGVLYLCGAEGSFIVYDYYNSKILRQYEGEYYYAENYGDYVYVVDSNSVVRFDKETNEFTSYRICSSSSAENRLSNAVDAVVYGNAIYIADSGSNRILIYDREKASYQTIATNAAPLEISADDSTVLVNSGNECAVYNLKGELLFSYSDLSGGELFLSSANVYGTYYVVTSNNYFCRIYRNENGEYKAEKTSKTLRSVAQEISSDLYGNIYVYFSDNTVYRFTEKNFTQTNEAGAYCYLFPASVSHFCADYAGNVYGMSENNLFSSAGDYAAFNCSDSVYTPESVPVKAVVDFSSNRVYILYRNYVLYTDVLSVPALNNIPSQNVSSGIFDSADTTLQALNVKAGSTLIAFDLDRLKDSTVFPYLNYTRTTEDKQCVKLGETDNYYVVSVFDNDTKKYTANIVLKSSCETVDSSYLFSEATGFENGQGYTSSSVALFRYPFLSESLSIVTLEKGCAVNIFGMITFNEGVDYRYYYVSVKTKNASYMGYVPVSYILPVQSSSTDKNILSYGYISTTDPTFLMTAEDGSTIEVSTSEKFSIYDDPYSSSTVTIGYTDSNGKVYYKTVSSSLLKTTNTGQLRTFIIIVIIVVALIILTDYFILRKRRTEDDEYD